MPAVMGLAVHMVGIELYVQNVNAPKTDDTYVRRKPQSEFHVRLPQYSVQYQWYRTYQKGCNPIRLAQMQNVPLLLPYGR